MARKTRWSSISMSVRDDVLPPLTITVFVCALVFGGAARREPLSDLVPQTLALGLIVLAAPVAWERLRMDRLALAILLSVIAVALAHLVPLPPALWSLLPGRSVFLEAYGTAGAPAPWLPLAARPTEAFRSVAALIPAIAIYLAVSCMDLRGRLALIFVMLLVAVLSVPLAVLQLLGGRGSPLYFFAITNFDRAVGFFANANHFAAFLYSCVPFCFAMFMHAAAPPRSILIGCVILLFLLFGLPLTGSRSAFLFGFLALAASIAWIARDHGRRLLRLRFGWAAALGLVIVLLPPVLSIGLTRIMARLESQDLVEDARWTIAQVSLDALWKYFPFGSGLGSFERIYQWSEPPRYVMAAVVNHAHNDWIEIGVEMGVFAYLLAGAFLIWLARAIAREALAAEGEVDWIARAALIVIALLLLHSIIDYPLRTIAMSCVLALSCGCLSPAERLSASGPTETRRRSSGAPGVPTERRLGQNNVAG